MKKLTDQEYQELVSEVITLKQQLEDVREFNTTLLGIVNEQLKEKFRIG